MTTKHRVWIELDKPKTNEDGEQRAKLLSAMLKRLGCDYGPHEPVWWDERKRRYCFTSSRMGTFYEGVDSGQWYNLEFLAGE